MQRRRVDRPWLHQVLFFVLAVGLSLACYPLKLTMLAGALLLSTILVLALRVVRSGAFSPLWLTRQNPQTIRNAAHLEMAKGFGCAGLAVDALVGGNRVMRAYQLDDPLSFTLLFTVSWLLTLGALLFLSRWLAATLLVTRR
jgi:hypothetical protein